MQIVAERVKEGRRRVARDGHPGCQTARIWLGTRIHRARIMPLPDLRVAVGKRKTSAIVVVPSECREIAPHVVRGAVGPGEPNEVKSIIQ